MKIPSAAIAAVSRQVLPPIRLLPSFRQASTSTFAGYHVDGNDTNHSVKRIGVIGAGQMGIGITLVAAQTAQTPVLLLDSNENQLEKQMKFLGKQFLPPLNQL